MASTTDGITLTRPQGQEMLVHVLRCLPEEACGLAGGPQGRVERVFPVTNELHSPVRFQMEPHEQVQALIWLEEREMDVVVIFHSHPNGPDHPSETDVSEWYYPDATALIWAPGAGGWQARAFCINREAGTYQEVPLNWEEYPPGTGSF